MQLHNAVARCLHLAVVMLLVSALSFSMLSLLPGSIAHQLAGEMASPEDIARIEQQMGLDRPLPERYVRWAGNALQGDLGISPTTRESVSTAISHRIPVSVQLMLYAQVLALLIALPAGLYAGAKEGGTFDRIVSSTSFGVLAVPTFVFGLILILVFSIGLGWLPATGYVPPSTSLFQNFRSMLLPALTLALAEAPVYIRVLRNEVSSTLREEFVHVARAKGMSRRQILLQHALRPSVFGLVTIMGVNIGHLIGGAVIVETLFALPGVGRLLIEAVTQRDFLTVQGIVLFVAISFVLINAVVDGVYALLDPRLRRRKRRA